MRRFRSLLRNVFRWRRVEQALDDEVQSCVDLLTQERVASGLTPGEARRQALITLGGKDQVKEVVRAFRPGAAVEDLVKDVRLAVRSLRATPVVATVTILSLALAIGANTAIFSIVNSLILRALPVSDPTRLVLVTDSVRPWGRAWDYPFWEQIRQRPALVEAAAAWSSTRFNLAASGETQFVDGLWVSGAFFETLGVRPLRGRTLVNTDDQRGGGPDGPVAVISSTFWQRQFGGATDVVGRTLRLDTVPFTIVGVTPPKFFGPEVGRTFDVIVPLGTEPLVRRRDSAVDAGSGRNFLTVVARLRFDQTVEAGTAALRGAQAAIRQAIRQATSKGLSQEVIDRYLSDPFTVVPAATGFSNLRRDYERAALVLMGVVALVLLIACVNIANLLLARATARRHELSVRLALGASRWRLARQLFTESLVLASLGTALGLLGAAWSSRALIGQLSGAFLDLSLDLRVLTFTASVAILTTLLFGTAPAFRATRVVPMDALKAQGRSATQETGPGLPGWLIVMQVTVSVVLVVAAGLFVRSFAWLADRPLGFDPDRLLVVTLDARRVADDIEQRVSLFGRIRESVRALPNVADAAVSFVLPVSGAGFTPAVQIAGPAPSRDDAAQAVTVPANGNVFGNLISPGWFSTFGTPLLAGRDFTDGDRRGSSRVAMVNEAFVRRYFGDSGPLGRWVTIYPGTPRARPMEVVGVVADAVYTSLRDPVPATWYAPLDQWDVAGLAFPSIHLSVRAQTGAPAVLAKGIESAIATVDSRVALTAQPLADRVDASLTRERMMAQLAGVFGALALVLAGVGLYGVTAYAVSRRRAEIGIRMALGAAPAGVIGLVLTRVSWLVGLGIVAGVAVSVWASPVVESLIYGLQPRDPMTLIGAGIVLAFVGVFAAWLPARRAARIDPIVVLRES
jgi:predicted permease